MKVAGFSFVRNGVKYGYPFKQSILSVLPLVDEFIINLGDSEDGTNEVVDNLPQEKIRKIYSVWDESLRIGGKVLAEETNKALDATSVDADWLFYIQGDEVIHEKDYEEIRRQMLKYKDDKNIDGLLFRYYHFYGSYRLLGDGRSWYPFEIRVIKNNKAIRSYRDAQGFRWEDGRKLNVKLINAHIYHYGWARNPVVMNRKQTAFSSLYNGKESNHKEDIAFDYSKIDSLTLFEATHPVVMKEIVEQEDWSFDRDINKKNFKSIKHRLYYFWIRNLA
ncbi:glycosyltransferase family protein [Niabella ginsengisoli]|uniref:Glycosyltransferase family 2 protein n=1 Tax=Niabella ginsengisoli TaxID=522298 RepID=A0ABS9SQZ5_9BACT|nr:glycosyltransferase family 2 protein [Niabella ginsengisoli]MCH5600795.1 glycosyltransferase family 2 protein [Niabella ginsengisoli]